MDLVGRKIFISGPMTGKPNYNRLAFNQLADQLRELGHSVMNPATLPDGFEWHEYAKVCNAMLDCCDLVLLMEGWEQSPGAMSEYYHAQRTKTEVELAKSFLYAAAARGDAREYGISP